MHILMTNDDGYSASGIQILAKEVASFARITMVAPETGVSSCSGALSLRRPVYLKKHMSTLSNSTVYSLSGTTADCCKIALEYLLKDDIPDLIISGMNNGFNTGSDCLYSGTVAGAMESIFLKIPAVAVSVEHNKDEAFLKKSAEFIKRIIQAYFFDHHYEGILNINIPYMNSERMKEPPCKVAPLALQLYSNVVEVKNMGEGITEFIMSGQPLQGEIPDTDVYWSRRGYVTITPLTWNQTDYGAMKQTEEIVKTI